MKYFNQNFRFLGDIINGDNKIEDVLCELNANIIDTNSMQVKLIPTNKSLFSIMANLKAKEPIKIISKNYYTKIYLESVFNSLNSDENLGQYATLNVRYFEHIDKYDQSGVLKKIHLSFYIPSSSIFSRERHFTSHYTRGILSGWVEKKERQNIKEEWVNEKYIIKSKFGFFEIVPSFLFGEIEMDESDKKGKFLIDQIILSVNLQFNKGLNYEVIDKISSEVNKFLRVISFLEGEFIEWNRLKIVGKNKNKFLYEKNISRWVVPLKNKFKDNIYYKKCRNDYLKLSSILFNRYIELKELEKKEFDKILDRFLIASTENKIDTQIIYWHSCLDILLKLFYAKGKSFTHKLIYVCKTNNIDWLDLFAYLTEESLKQKKEIEINKIRNDIIHYGVHPVNYDRIIKELPNVKSMCERLICKALGVDYRNTCIGKYKKGFLN